MYCCHAMPRRQATLDLIRLRLANASYFTPKIPVSFHPHDSTLFYRNNIPAFPRRIPIVLSAIPFDHPIVETRLTILNRLNPCVNDRSTEMKGKAKITSKTPDRPKKSDANKSQNAASKTQEKRPANPKKTNENIDELQNNQSNKMSRANTAHTEMTNSQTEKTIEPVTLPIKKPSTQTQSTLNSSSDDTIDYATKRTNLEKKNENIKLHYFDPNNSNHLSRKKNLNPTKKPRRRNKTFHDDVRKIYSPTTKTNPKTINLSENARNHIKYVRTLPPTI